MKNSSITILRDVENPGQNRSSAVAPQKETKMILPTIRNKEAPPILGEFILLTQKPLIPQTPYSPLQIRNKAHLKTTVSIK